MKKGRTGVQMTVLCRPGLVRELQDILFRETTTIGLRWRLENKVALAREFVEVKTGWGKVRIKIARLKSAPSRTPRRSMRIAARLPRKIQSLSSR